MKPSCQGPADLLASRRHIARSEAAGSRQRCRSTVGDRGSRRASAEARVYRLVCYTVYPYYKGEL